MTVEMITKFVPYYSECAHCDEHTNINVFNLMISYIFSACALMSFDANIVLPPQV